MTAKNIAKAEAVVNPPLRIVPGRTGTAKCTLSHERKGEAIILKLSPFASDALAAMGWTRAVPEWLPTADGKMQLRLIQQDGAGYIISKSRRLRPHVSFPTRGVKLAHTPVILSEPRGNGDALTFDIPAGSVVMPAPANGGAHA
jgi:hypothetical protein